MTFFFYFELQVHLEVRSEVPDHCIIHVLNRPKTPSSQTTCEHQHNLGCEACDALRKCFKDIDEAFTALNFPSEVMTRFTASLNLRRRWRTGRNIRCGVIIKTRLGWMCWTASLLTQLCSHRCVFMMCWVSWVSWCCSLLQTLHECNNFAGLGNEMAPKKL